MTTPVDLMLVDDDDIDRELVRRLISDRYTVHEAATGGDALMLVQKQPPACILLDYRLPDIGGLQLLPQFTAAYLPVIILTGEESPEVIVQAMQLGAQDYLVKGSLTRMSLEHAIVNAIEKMAMRRDIDDKNRQLRHLASALTIAEQRERRRISQILHDDVQQTLYGIQMRTHLIRLDGAGQPAIEEHVQALDNLTREAIRTTRTLTVELSPPGLRNEGLAATFQWLANHMAEMHGLRVVLDSQSDYHCPSQDLQVLLFQLVRELLFNVVKHAGVNQAEVVLFEEGDHVVIRVVDQGRGFEAARLQGAGSNKGFGLYSVRERLALFGGQLAIDTKPGEGVRATIIVPKEFALALTGPA
jgi:signal transduction histidine kinase